MFTFRHMHGYKWGTDDLYFTCLLRPLNTEVNPNLSEIAAVKWMSVSIPHILVSGIYTTEAGLYAEILQRGDKLGVFKKRGGAAASSVRGNIGRQC